MRLKLIVGKSMCHNDKMTSLLTDNNLYIIQLHASKYDTLNPFVSQNVLGKLKTCS